MSCCSHTSTILPLDGAEASAVLRHAAAALPTRLHKARDLCILQRMKMIWSVWFVDILQHGVKHSAPGSKFEGKHRFLAVIYRSSSSRWNWLHVICVICFVFPSDGSFSLISWFHWPCYKHLSGSFQLRVTIHHHKDWDGSKNRNRTTCKYLPFIKPTDISAFCFSLLNLPCSQRGF